jgi:hypothetical protein
MGKKMKEKINNPTTTKKSKEKEKNTSSQAEKS